MADPAAPKTNAKARSYRRKAAPSPSPERKPVPATQNPHRGGRSTSRSRSRSRSPKKPVKPSDKPELNTIHRGRVVSARDFGCFIRLTGFPRDGMLHISEASSERITPEELRALFPQGSTRWVQVSSVAEDGKVGLSARNIDQSSGEKRRGAESSAPKGGKTSYPTPEGSPPEIFSIHKGCFRRHQRCRTCTPTITRLAHSTHAPPPNTYLLQTACLARQGGE